MGVNSSSNIHTARGWRGRSWACGTIFFLRLPVGEYSTTSTVVYVVAQSPETLRHKPDGRGFDSRWG